MKSIRYFFRFVQNDCLLKEAKNRLSGQVLEFSSYSTP